MTKKELEGFKHELCGAVVEIRKLIQHGQYKYAFVKYETVRPIAKAMGYDEYFVNELKESLKFKGYSEVFIESFMCSCVDYRTGEVYTVERADI